MSFPFTALLLSQSSVGWQSGREDRVRGGRRCWGYFNVRTQQVRRGFVAIKETVKAKHDSVDGEEESDQNLCFRWVDENFIQKFRQEKHGASPNWG